VVELGNKCKGQNQPLFSSEAACCLQVSSTSGVLLQQVLALQAQVMLLFLVWLKDSEINVAHQ